MSGWHKCATKHQDTKGNVSQLLEEIKRHHEAMDAGHPEEKPPCPRWSRRRDCRGHVIWRGRVTRTGLKVGTEDRLPPVQLWQCECRLHGWFRVYTPFVLPNKHYVALQVDAALACAAAGGKVSQFCSDTGIHDPSTPLRWRRQWAHRLASTGLVVRRCLGRLVYQRFGAGRPRIPAHAEWTFHSAWAFLTDAQRHWPLETMVPPRSYLALKA